MHIKYTQLRDQDCPNGAIRFPQQCHIHVLTAVVPPCLSVPRSRTDQANMCVTACSSVRPLWLIPRVGPTSEPHGIHACPHRLLHTRVVMPGSGSEVGGSCQRHRSPSLRWCSCCRDEVVQSCFAVCRWQLWTFTVHLGRLLCSLSTTQHYATRPRTALPMVTAEDLAPIPSKCAAPRCLPLATW